MDADLEAIKRIAGVRDDTKMTAEVQLNRIMGRVWRNPFDVFQLDMNATEDDIRKKYKMFTVILHPDKCSDPRATDAFTIIDMCYKTLQDPGKKKMFQRIMAEAKELTDHEREVENKKRKKLGQSALPEDTYNTQYNANCRRIFEEIEEKKRHLERLELGAQRRRQEEIEKITIKEQYRLKTQEEWENSQDDRIRKWQHFSKNKGRIGSKGSNCAIRGPSMRPEEKPSEFTDDKVVHKNVLTGEDNFKKI